MSTDQPQIMAVEEVIIDLGYLGLDCLMHSIIADFAVIIAI